MQPEVPTNEGQSEEPQAQSEEEVQLEAPTSEGRNEESILAPGGLVIHLYSFYYYVHTYTVN